MRQLTKEYLQELFEYKEGMLYWKIKKSNNIKKGDVAGSKAGRGYHYVYIDNKNYLLHRIVFLHHYGYVPKYLDHINRDRTDNRIENLRIVSLSQNNQNTGILARNTSGYKGVAWAKRNSKWRVEIGYDNKRKHIGYYDDLELADLVAQEARDLYHKEFARHE